jgi:Ca2+-binding EF-hand superfamily protein
MSKGVFMKNITKKSFLFAAAALFLSPAFANAERPSREEVQADRESFFMAADEDESGGLTSEELEVFHSLAEASRAERKFVRADMNEDGELSLEELGKMDRKKHRSKRFR